MPDEIVPVTPETPPVTPETPPEGDTFPRAYVETLRRENADYRTRAKRADDLSERVLRLEVAATGKLADPADLPFDAALVDDPAALAAAIDALVAAKPHLASRIPRGDVDQGVRETPATTAGWGSLFG
ncbi:hypothetical protein [Modestobacter sp. SSW1-42]|uniref:hypothetical protein n=1 Tax=Modestobacter sp. SSW1-42 TaxID=596372 RepID=UPI0039873F1E